MAIFNSSVNVKIQHFNRYSLVMVKTVVEVEPGQFFMFYTDFVKKPFSVAFKDSGYLGFVIKPVGRFTRNMPATIRLEGPYGNGFLSVPNTLDEDRGNLPLLNPPLLISGGAGLAPILFLAQRLTEKGHNFTWYHGDREEVQDIINVLPFRPHHIILEPEMVTDKLLPSTSLYFACGPNPMLQATVNNLGTNGFVALEERMLCGYGACQGCVVETTEGYQRVCKDGPIFKAGDIKWS